MERGNIMYKPYDETESLRKDLLDEAYAGAFSDLGAMILDADEIRNADKDELKEIARRYGKG
jgi:hypothetical protein